MANVRRISSLSTLWTAKLPNTTSGITTPLINQNSIYAGNMGHIYRLDYLTA